MHTSHIRNKLNLYWTKGLIVGILVLFGTGAKAQLWQEIHNPNWDNRKMITYGFSIGLHTASFKLNYSNAFIQPDMDSLHSIQPPKTPGFSLGFIVNSRVNELVDVRVTPRVGFYEYKAEYNFTNGTIIKTFVESTSFEFPILVKYKSERRKNMRMYMVGGGNPMIEVSGKNDFTENEDGLHIKNFDFRLEAGFGFDIYYPLFKFSPEIRFSYGLVNVLGGRVNPFNKGIDRLNTRAVSIYLHFQ